MGPLCRLLTRCWYAFDVPKFEARLHPKDRAVGVLVCPRNGNGTAPTARFRSAQKKRQPSALHPAGMMSSQGELCRGDLCRDGIEFGASGADDLIGGAEDFLGALFRYCFRIKTASTTQPMLNIAAAKSAPSRPKDSQQRSATDSASTSHRLRGVVSSSAKSASVV